jgi:hypothetical protein
MVYFQHSFSGHNSPQYLLQQVILFRPVSKNRIDNRVLGELID